MFSKKKLWISIQNGLREEAFSLIKEAADVNAIYTGIENESGQTFLQHALNNGRVDMALFLLDKGADASICDANGDSVLYYFIKSGLYQYIHLAERLIERGAPINKRIGGYSFLCLAFLKMPQIVSFLLKHKADIFEAPYVDGKSRLDLFFPADVVAYRDLPYLSLAVLKNDIDSFRYLIKYSEIINATDSYGRTPLMIAALQNDERMALELINAGSFLDIKDFAGRSVRDYFKNMAEKRYQQFLIAESNQKAVAEIIAMVDRAKEFSFEADEDVFETKNQRNKKSLWGKIKSFLGFR